MWSADSAAVEPCTTRASRGLHPEACQGLHLLARRRLQPLQVVTAFRSCVCRRAWDRPARCAGGFHRAPQSGLQISNTVEKRCQNVLSPILFGPPVRSRSHRRTHSIFQTSTITAIEMCFHSLALNRTLGDASSAGCSIRADRSGRMSLHNHSPICCADGQKRS